MPGGGLGQVKQETVMRGRSGFFRLIISLALLAAILPSRSVSAQLRSNEWRAVELTNGMRFIGKLGSLKSMGATNVDVSPDTRDFGIILIADELREVFVSRFNIANDNSPFDRQEEKFEITQTVHKGDANSFPVGEILQIGPFDRWGRRAITSMTHIGPETTIQGITEVTPRYVKLEGVVNSGGAQAPWEMYIALSSIPPQTIVDVLHLQIKDPTNANERMRLVDFFAQAGKFNQAENELQGIRRDFPGLDAPLAKKSEVLRGQVVREMLGEVRLRANAGQPEIAGQMLIPLLSRTDLPSAVLVEISDARKMLGERTAEVERAKQILQDVAARTATDMKIEEETRTSLDSAVQEILSQLRQSGIDRLSTFLRLADDPDLEDIQKVALAVSGWFSGAGNAIENAGTVQSMVTARGLVIEYLQTDSATRRDEIIHELEMLEAGAVPFLDGIIKHILPPLAPDPATIPFDKPLEFPITVGNPERQAGYLVQLPPEYDPYRRYPCIVALGASSDSYTTPEAQIEWWCGQVHEQFGIRTGHASRNGYIVIAPRWTRPGQESYEYSAIEHAIVLKSVRDAMRRFSIDSDRVFLTGHFEGGTAAWDIGQAHPEHWAGVIPISARADKYLNHTIRNGKFYSSYYFVNGSRDFLSRDMNKNIWNNRIGSKDYQTVVVLFRGRGTEKFGDELTNIFQWMSVIRRRTDVQEFECDTLRTFDNYFWWVEFDLTSNEKMIPPEQDWAGSKPGRSSWTIEGKRNVEKNELRIRGSTGGSGAIVWLSPENADFSRDVTIAMQSKSVDLELKPSRRVILEDARLRSDRQHPRWAKAVFENNKWQLRE
jgi:pimeloyl-ACP methyl ester carboxylesterase